MTNDSPIHSASLQSMAEALEMEMPCPSIQHAQTAMRVFLQSADGKAIRGNLQTIKDDGAEFISACDKMVGVIAGGCAVANIPKDLENALNTMAENLKSWGNDFSKNAGNSIALLTALEKECL